MPWRPRRPWCTASETESALGGLKRLPPRTDQEHVTAALAKARTDLQSMCHAFAAQPCLPPRRRSVPSALIPPPSTVSCTNDAAAWACACACGGGTQHIVRSPRIVTQPQPACRSSAFVSPQQLQIGLWRQ